VGRGGRAGQSTAQADVHLLPGAIIGDARQPNRTSTGTICAYNARAPQTRLRTMAPPYLCSSNHAGRAKRAVIAGKRQAAKTWALTPHGSC